MKKTIIFLILLTISISTISLGYDTSSSYIWSTDAETSPVTSSITSNTTSSNTLETNSQIETSNSLNLESGAAILIEQSTGQILYEHNAHE
jgi:hypothetical protein